VKEMTGKEYVYSRADEVMKLVAKVVYTRVLTLLRQLPPYIRNDVTMAADDMVMEATEHVLEKAGMFDASREDAFSTWVSIVAYNYCKSRMIDKRTQPRRLVPGGALVRLDKRIVNAKNETQEATVGELVPSDENILEEFAAKEDTRQAAARIARLVNRIDYARDREIMWMLIGGKTLREVGAMYGLQAERVRQIRVQRAAEIRMKLEKEDRKDERREERSKRALVEKAASRRD